MDQPKYLITKPEFYCPLSPYIKWHHGLQFAECPINSSNRDMPECKNCKYGGKSLKPKRKKMPPKKEQIPVIKKTYTSK